MSEFYSLNCRIIYCNIVNFVGYFIKIVIMLCDGRTSDKPFPKLNIFKESNSFSFQSLRFDERIGIYMIPHA